MSQDFDPSRNYYADLELTQEASNDKIKAAYRRLARKYHPDISKELNASHIFNKITEAHTVLTDEKKKSSYDSYRNGKIPGSFNVGAGFGSNFDHSDFGSVYVDFFSRNFRHVNVETKNTEYANVGLPVDGEDLEITLNVSLREAYTGYKKDILVQSGPTITCASCNGHGFPPMASTITCGSCNGVGRKVQLGKSLGQRTKRCDNCKGRGKVPTTWCRSCGGKGHAYGEKNIKVNIPAGISDGDKLRLAGQGTPGVNSKPGDLFVNVKVDDIFDGFRRSGSDLHCVCRVPLFTVLNGGTYTMKHIDGSDISIVIDPGGGIESPITIKGKGITHPMRKVSGDLIVKLEIQVPKLSSDRAKELAKELENEIGK